MITRIGIDGRSLEMERTGIGRYLENLLREWSRPDPSLRFEVFTIGPSPPDEVLAGDAFHLRRFGFEFHQEGQLHSAALATDPPDVFFSPLYELPDPLTVPSVITVHDLVHEACPEAFTEPQLQYLRARHDHTLRHADRIITDSAFARTQLVTRYPDVESRLEVVPLAADPRFSPTPHHALELERALLERELGLVRPFVLYVGAISGKRHVPSLVHAFLSSDLMRARSWRLVLIGRNYLPRPADLDEALDEAGSRVIHCDHVSNELLVTLYRHASLFVYPSTYEGFGMPPLEAMACGAPVVAARFTATPEVVGDAAVLVERPWEPAELLEAMERLAEDAELRGRMREAGFARAAQFRWSETARRTLQIITNLVP